ncbi:oxygenase [Mycolicibacterium novocastrense]|uniref:FAD-dependent monooxygenase n=1 Tax=Mycolicibacterium novocastrense TaxID=59813 RepID=UPI0007491617|nr:FAD-dependent monooxygenase [Mycolicibacterium novocastrense]KUH64649.1 oxygenase [Mycolicibacterium novocastrense]KUH64838.1 oxygenase [Mycolicibacterium novocastrense]KUH76926.1 oxygenase [Mycolicibacterium novocastrense]
MNTDVLVVGAGPTGLAAACGLLMQGIPVRVIDAAAAPATTSRANFLHARGSEVLDRLGALGDLPDRSVRAMSILTYLGGKPIMRIRFGDPGMDTAAPPMVISQAAVEGALRDRLTELGGEISWGAKLTDVHQDGGTVSAVLAGGDDLTAGWLIGCDGAGSATRRATGIDFPGVRLTERFLLADLRIDWDLDRSGTTGWLHQDGMLGAMPMPDGLWRIIAYDPHSGPQKPTDEEILARLNRIIPQRTGRSAPIEHAEWLSLFSVHRRLATTYRRGRVLIAGDAAHTHAPFGGQGMLTGLGDAENLAWKLALVTAGIADERLLDTYEAERRPLATEVLRNTSAVTKVNVAQSRIGRFVRDRVVVPVMNLPAVQRWVTYRTSQLWVSYRRGPLADRSLRLSGLRPGDRVPGLSGHELRGRWGLLGADELATIAAEHLGDGRIALIDGRIDGDAMLVRPDGHLAWRGRQPEALRRWLSRALTTGSVR